MEKRILKKLCCGNHWVSCGMHIKDITKPEYDDFWYQKNKVWMLKDCPRRDLHNMGDLK